jgi:1,4-dihydroxy-2-naphthoyl-CoA hydrolase
MARARRETDDAGMTDTVSTPDVPGEAAQTAAVHQAMPFTRLLGLEICAYAPDEVRATLAWTPELCTSGGILHGGVLMALADSLGGAVAVINLPEGATGTATVSSATNFLRPVRGGTVHACARPLHRGRTTIVVDTELRDDDGRLVARVTQTQAVLGGNNP